ncbi:MAG: acetyl-CoA carboxylase carboxyl transferase subunit alpha, partial [Limisphaerales bacterium]
ALKITARDLLGFGIVDEIVAEPLGGAHNDPLTMAETLKVYLVRHLTEVASLPVAERLQRRYDKYRRIGSFIEKPVPPPPAAD